MVAGSHRADVGSVISRKRPGGPAYVVLVIEDHENACAVVADLLASTGAHAIAARDVDEARTILRALHVDAIVTDCRSPDAPGVSFLRELRATSEHVEVPLIILTGEETAEIAIQAESLGARCLATPIVRAELAAVLSGALGRVYS